MKLALVSSHLVQHRSTSDIWLWFPNMLHLSFTVASFSISHIATSKNQYQNTHRTYLVWNYMSNWRIQFMGIYSSCWTTPRPFSLKPSKQQQQNAKIIVMFIFNLKKMWVFEDFKKCALSCVFIWKCCFRAKNKKGNLQKLERWRYQEILAQINWAQHMWDEHPLCEDVNQANRMNRTRKLVYNIWVQETL